MEVAATEAVERAVEWAVVLVGVEKEVEVRAEEWVVERAEEPVAATAEVEKVAAGTVVVLSNHMDRPKMPFWKLAPTGW